MVTYEIWMLDDAGNRIIQIQNFFYLSYSRVVQGLGIVQIGMSFLDFSSQVTPYFKPDRRLEVWRSPDTGIPPRRDAAFLIREPRVYTRDSDGLLIFELYGRSYIDLLSRRAVPQYAGSTYTTKTDYIDDMMKEIVRENCLYGTVVDETGTVDNDRAFPQYEFSVEPDLSLGPSVTRSFADKEMLDVLEDLRDLSFQKYEESSANRKIYFDVIPYDLNNYLIYILDKDSDIFLDEAGDGILDETSVQTLSPSGFRFITIADRFGIDRTDTMFFSEANGNFIEGSYLLSHMDEVNVVYVKGQGEGQSRQVETLQDNSRISSSRWNRIERLTEASNETTTAGLQSAGNEELANGLPREEISGTFISIPEGPDNPRSLYGVDWDLGDLVVVQYAEKTFEAEIKIVHVSYNSTDGEKILGRNKVE